MDLERKSSSHVMNMMKARGIRPNITTLLDAIPREPAETVSDTADMASAISKQRPGPVLSPVNEGTDCASGGIEDKQEQAFGCADLGDFTGKTLQMRKRSSVAVTGDRNIEAVSTIYGRIHVEADTTFRTNPEAKLSKAYHVSSVLPVSSDSSEGNDAPLSKHLSSVSAERSGCVLTPQISHDSEISSYNVVDLRERLHIEKLVTSDASSSCDSDSSCSEDGDSIMQKGDSVKCASIGSAHGFPDFRFGKPETLCEFVKELRSKQRLSGIYIWNGIKPVPRKGVLCYEVGTDKEFHVVKDFRSYSVFLCQDNSSKELFVLKKIPASNDRLVGIEFLTKHRQDFLLQIYGVYKDEDFFWIFQEFIQGVTVKECKWNFQQVHQFADCLLSTVWYLHKHEIVHFDIKPMNLMVRDSSCPRSLVMIDFESTKHPDPRYHFATTGYTLTYLPPWFKRIWKLTKFDSLLMTSDLWASGCVLTTLLSSGHHGNPQHYSCSIWSKKMNDIHKECPYRCRGHTPCRDCRSQFLSFVETEGSQILNIHLEQLMRQGSDDPHWRTLRPTLEYLTDVRNVEGKTADKALHILRGDYQHCHQQAAVDEDYNLR